MQVLFQRSRISHWSSFLNTVSFSTNKTWVAVVLRSTIPVAKWGKVIPAWQWIKNVSKLEFEYRKITIWVQKQTNYHFYQYCNPRPHYRLSKSAMDRRWDLSKLTTHQAPMALRPEGNISFSTPHSHSLVSVSQSHFCNTIPWKHKQIILWHWWNLNISTCEPTELCIVYWSEEAREFHSTCRK